MFKNKLFQIQYISLALSILLTILIVQSTSGQNLSEGCLEVDTISAVNINGTERLVTFYENERITIVASDAVFGKPTGLRLEINGVIVASTPIPGSITWIVPADGLYHWKFYLYSDVPIIGFPILSANFEVSCDLVPVDETNTHCPVFADGRINHCDTFNPVVLYGNVDADEQWGLEVYSAEQSLLLFAVNPEAIAAVEDCPAGNTLIYQDIVNQIYFYRLSSCEYYLRAPMNEAGKWYIIVFDELYPNTYYESWTEFISL